MDKMTEERTPGCAVCVYHGKEKAYEYATGVSSLETGKKLVGDEYFNIYSCSKITTVCAGLILLERGEFLLTDPLYEYIPEYRHMTVREPNGELHDAKRVITVGDIFSMTAGLNYDINSESIRKVRETDPEMHTDAVIRAIANEPLSFEPGTKWQYSLCHDVLAGLVGVISGMPFRDFVKNNIFKPLEMNDTFYHATPETLSKTAEQYRFLENGVNVSSEDLAKLQELGNGKDGKFVNVGREVQAYILGSEYDSGGAGITTTCGDYAKVLAMLANRGLGLTGERILSSATVELMKTNRLVTPELAANFNWPQLVGYGYGLGVRTHIDRARSGSVANIGEFGWGGAAGATAIIDTELGLSAFFVQHTLNPREGWYQPRLKNVIYAAAGDAPARYHQG